MEYERAVALKQFSRLWPLAAAVVAVLTISVITVSIFKVADHPPLLFMAPRACRTFKHFSYLIPHQSPLRAQSDWYRLDLRHCPEEFVGEEQRTVSCSSAHG
jgi:hypothetical protein